MITKTQAAFLLAIAGYTNGIQLSEQQPAGTSPADFLAQIQQSSDPHTCTTAHDRVNNSQKAVTSFQSILDGKKKFTDKTFPFNDALYWADMNNENKHYVKGHQINWIRASDKFPKRTLYGTTINPNDISQGEIGNCWLMGAISGFAEYHERVEKAFVNDDVSRNGIYGVNLYPLGVPHTVVIDDYLALMDGEDSTIYAQLSDDNGLWGPFIEKAFAKLHGNFAHIDGGDPSEAVMTLNGGPRLTMQHTAEGAQNYNTEQMSASQIYDELHKNDVKKAIMTTGTAIVDSGDSEKNEFGLYYSHVYTVLGTYELDDGTRLIKVRNPHGKSPEHDGGYKGRWHDNDPRWTKELLKKVKHTKENDGIFMIDEAQFHAAFTETWINPSTLRWHQDYFLKLKDQNKNPKYTLTVTNIHKQKQTVHIGGHTQQMYGYGKDDKCSDFAENRVCYVIKGNKTCKEFASGDMWLPKITMMPEQTVNVEIQLDFSYGQKNDWSVTAWGETGKVKVALQGDETHHLPHIKASGEINDGEEPDESDVKPKPDENDDVKPDGDGQDGDDVKPDGDGQDGDDMFPDGDGQDGDYFPDGDGQDGDYYPDGDGQDGNDYYPDGDEYDYNDDFYPDGDEYDYNDDFDPYGPEDDDWWMGDDTNDHGNDDFECPDWAPWC